MYTDRTVIYVYILYTCIETIAMLPIATFLYRPGNSIYYENDIAPADNLIECFDNAQQIDPFEFPDEKEEQPTLLYVSNSSSIGCINYLGPKLKYILVHNPMVDEKAKDILKERVPLRCTTGGILYITEEAYQEDEDVNFQKSPLAINHRRWREDPILNVGVYYNLECLLVLYQRPNYITYETFFPGAGISMLPEERYKIKGPLLCIDHLTLMESIQPMSNLNTPDTSYPDNSSVTGVLQHYELAWNITTIGGQLTCQFNGDILQGKIISSNTIELEFSDRTTHRGCYDYACRKLVWDDLSVWLVKSVEPIIIDTTKTEADIRESFNATVSRIISGEQHDRAVYHSVLLEIAGKLTRLSHISDGTSIVGNVYDIKLELEKFIADNLPRLTF